MLILKKGSSENDSNILRLYLFPFPTHFIFPENIFKARCKDFSRNHFTLSYSFSNTIQLSSLPVARYSVTKSSNESKCRENDFLSALGQIKDVQPRFELALLISSSKLFTFMPIYT